VQTDSVDGYQRFATNILVRAGSRADDAAAKEKTILASSTTFGTTAADCPFAVFDGDTPQRLADVPK
jgi:hypothetical protein